MFEAKIDQKLGDKHQPQNEIQIICRDNINIALWPISNSLGSSDYSQVNVVVTARDTGQRLASAGEEALADSPPIIEKQNYIFIDPSKTFQTVIGIGGALTDASAETFYKLPKDRQQEILTAYFDPKNGIGYSLGRPRG